MRKGSMPPGRDALAARFTRAWSANADAPLPRFILLQPDPDSPLAQRLAIKSRAEAAAYLQHDVLGPHLVECTRLAVVASDKSITYILGSPDDMKFRSSMTLFDAVSKQLIFTDAIAAIYPEGKDRRPCRYFSEAKLVDRGPAECGTAPCASWRAADDASHRNQSAFPK
ncbi:DUF1810 family protein [Bradyrhizobium sp. HKCCYLRH2015]|uniref:DUF1810 family protein n=1 Tax=Bradyrhizobium sp. HKCCYLRH2015 TaxID=3420742 RepID=UPI003EC00D3C